MYEIVLYNNGKRSRHVKNFKYYTDALKVYNEMLSNNKVFFSKETMWDGTKTDYELALLAPGKNSPKEFSRNEFGAIVKIKTKGDFVIKQIEKYQIEEAFKDKIKDKRMFFKDLVKDILKNKELSCTVYVLHNKLILEYLESEEICMYVTKNNDDTYRLAALLRKFTITNGLANFMYFMEPNLDSRIRIYDLLQNKYGFEREYLYRPATR